MGFLHIGDSRRPAHSPQRLGGVNRRIFIASSGASAALAPSFAAADDPAPRFTTVNGVVQLVWVAGGVTRVWRIDPDWFSVIDASGGAGPVLRETGRRVEIKGRFSGTSIPADFQIDLVLRQRVWHLEWRHAGGRATALTVQQWFSGRTIGITIRRPAGPTDRREVYLSGELRGTLGWPFNLAVAAGGRSARFVLAGAEGTASRVVLRCFHAPVDGAPSDWEPLTPDLASVAGTGAQAKVRVALDGVVLDDARGFPLGNVGGSDLWVRSSVTKAFVEVVRTTSPRPLAMARFLSGGDARLRIGSPTDTRAMIVERAHFLETRDHHAFWAAATTAPRMVQAKAWSALVRGNAADEPNLDFRTKGRISIPVILQVLHMRGDDDGRYDLDLRARGNSDPYLDRRATTWTGEGLGGVAATITIGSPAPAPDLNANTLHLGPASAAHVLLNRPQARKLDGRTPLLRVRRHGDGVDLGFNLHGHRLEITARGARVIPGPSAQRAVIFNPQHIQEEVFRARDQTAAPAGVSGRLAAAWGAIVAFSRSLVGVSAPVPRTLGDPAKFAGEGFTTVLARIRSAPPTRIAFAPQDNDQPFSLTIASLTDWSRHTLLVHDRIEKAAGTVDEQLTSIGIREDTTREAAQSLVKASLTRPGEDMTSLELVAGLSFSPDARARFRTPRRPPGDNPGLWTAQLELSPLRAGDVPSIVRAVWADGMDPEALIGTPECRPAQEGAAEDQFVTSLTQKDRTEVVMLTSGVGLAALRAVTLEGQDIPQGMVRRPKATFKYLDNTDTYPPGNAQGPKVKREGVMMPSAFRRFEARLTGFGADIDIDWQGEPPAPSRPPFFNEAFSVERYLHRTSLGSDVRVQVIYKGFLFPYGFRVSLIKVTEREPSVVDGMGAMMPSIQRYFILPKPVEKAYPGIYQPFGGREAPLRHARLASVLSPELDPAAMSTPPGLSINPATRPKDDCAFGNRDDRDIRGRVFWPTIKGTTAQVSFDFEADGTGVPRSLPMLFMDNAAVHDPATVRATMEYYNSLVEDRRLESHHGGRTIFAEPSASGDTSFETESIIVAARSRLVAVEPTAGSPPRADAEYEMDAFMEGADEPPFYPVMVSARVKVPAVEQLLGTPQGVVRVGFNGNYIRKGLSREGNPSELYLNFLTADRVMQLEGRGEVSGGVAQTPTSMAGISRSNAIVGASARTPDRPVSLAGAPSGQPEIGADAMTPFDLESVEQGRFEPSSFFKLGKLLGVIDIGQVVKAALISEQPKLQQTFEYALQSSNAAAGFRDVCGKAAGAIGRALDTAEAALLAAIGGAAPAGRAGYPTLQRYYPALARGLVELKGEFESARGGADILSAAPKLLSAWRRLKGSVDAVVANPSPEPLREILADLRRSVDEVQNAVGAALRASIAAPVRTMEMLVEGVVDTVLDACVFGDDLAGLAVFDSVFGPLRPLAEADADGVIQPPTRAELRILAMQVLVSTETIPTATLTAPLAETVLKPLLVALGTLRSLRDSVIEIDPLTLGEVAQAASSAVQAAVGTLAALDAYIDIAESSAARMCDVTTAPALRMVGLALDSLPTPATSAAAGQFLDDRLRVLLLPDLDQSPAYEAVRTASAGLRAAVSTLAAHLASINEERSILSAILADPTHAMTWCRAPGTAASAVARLVRLKHAVLTAMTDCSSHAARVRDALATAPQGAVADATRALGDACDQLRVLAYRSTMAVLADTADETMSSLGQALAVLDDPSSTARPIGDRIATIRAEVFGLSARMVAGLPPASPGSVAALASFVGLAQRLANSERTLLALATDFTAVPKEVLGKLGEIRDHIATATLKPFIDIHVTVSDVADRAVAWLDAAPDLVLLLTGPILARLKLARDAVRADTVALRSIAADPLQAGALYRRWSTASPGLAITATTLLELFSAVARGQLGAVFDLRAVRQVVEDALRQLLPTNVTTSYVWDAQLEAFPPGSPIFIPGSAESALPLTGQKDLQLSTIVKVNLLDPRSRSVTVTGKIAPFKLHLLGGIVDLCTISFRDTRFDVRDGGRPSFSTDITAVEMGTALKFVSALEPFMSPGAGFNILPSLDPPGVNISYTFAAPVIPLGGMTVLNVALEVGALLAFDSSPALFRFAFASSERPFGLIVAPCYFGGGFVSLLARADGIQQFEIQFEFGAATAISFGPLRGQGRVTTGIYLRSNMGVMLLRGFVHAVGEGQIACFGISVNLEVAVESSGSTMTGKARYRFTFRVGMFKVGYSFEAKYTFQGGSKSITELYGVLPAVEAPVEYLQAPDRDEDWVAYRACFVEEWPTA